MDASSHFRRGVCPNCHCEVVRRSHRVGLLERIVLNALSVRPYRCSDCDKRFYRYDGGLLRAVPVRSR